RCGGAQRAPADGGGGARAGALGRRTPPHPRPARAARRRRRAARLRPAGTAEHRSGPGRARRKAARPGRRARPRGAGPATPGLPAPRSTDLDPCALAERLLARIDAHGPVVLVGHSASCQVVAAAAARTRVAGLVLVGPTTDPRAVGWPTLAARWLRTAGHERPGQVPRLAHDYARTAPGAMLRGMAAARRHRIERALAGVDCPVLVVRGRHDRIAPADWTAALAAAAPRGRAHTLPAGAHMVPITHPAAIAAVIAEFLGRTA